MRAVANAKTLLSVHGDSETCPFNPFDDLVKTPTKSVISANRGIVNLPVWQG